jgi:hypothetical protein
MPSWWKCKATELVHWIKDTDSHMYVEPMREVERDINAARQKLVEIGYSIRFVGDLIDSSSLPEKEEYSRLVREAMYDSQAPRFEDLVRCSDLELFL